MVLYVQAFVGSIAIPLTYVLARHFIGKKSSLMAAGLIALHPALIGQVAVLYTEALYTLLLLLTLLSLLYDFNSIGFTLWLHSTPLPKSKKVVRQ